MVLSNTVYKTSYKLQTGRKSSLKHLHVQGYPAKIKIYNPYEKKLDSSTTSDFFNGYPVKYKRYRFYCPNHNTRVVEVENDKFIENDEVSGSETPYNVEI